MSLSHIIGREDAKLALMLNAVDPRCGGILLVGEKGGGKSFLARSFAALAGEDVPFVEIPLNVTEDALFGDIDLERTVLSGTVQRQAGLLERAVGGVLYVDDIHLLSPEITYRLSSVGQNYRLLASMTPEEGSLSAHFLDCFGMCVTVETIREAPERAALVRRVVGGGSAGMGFNGDGEGAILERIRFARKRVEGIVFPDEVLEHLILRCLEYGASGHRGDVCLFYAARAYAALNGAAVVEKGHVDRVLPLVLTHRMRDHNKTEGERGVARDTKEDTGGAGKEAHRDGNGGPAGADDGGAASAGRGDGRDGKTIETFAAEEVFAVGKEFAIRRLAFRKDRRERTVAGRRTKTGSRDKRGRHIGTIMRKNGDIDLAATIRAAAPWQKRRNGGDVLAIRREDLRYRRRERRMGHLVVFVVDGSGSMGAKRRMVETKGAVQSLLSDCYQKREKVSLVVFRKDKAEIVLPPTSSVEMAARYLREVPVGGKTPLAAGLLEAFKLIRGQRRKKAETRFLVVIVTDGRANQSITGAPVREELDKVVALMKTLPATDFVVVDTEDKRSPFRTDLARNLSAALGGGYYEMADLKSPYLTSVIRERKEQSLPK